jgi:hypothetical protein
MGIIPMLVAMLVVMLGGSMSAVLSSSPQSRDSCPAAEASRLYRNRVADL